MGAGVLWLFGSQIKFSHCVPTPKGDTIKTKNARTKSFASLKLLHLAGGVSPNKLSIYVQHRGMDNKNIAWNQAELAKHSKPRASTLISRPTHAKCKHWRLSSKCPSKKYTILMCDGPIIIPLRLWTLVFHKTMGTTFASKKSSTTSCSKRIDTQAGSLRIPGCVVTVDAMLHQCIILGIITITFYSMS